MFVTILAQNEIGRVLLPVSDKYLVCSPRVVRLVGSFVFVTGGISFIYNIVRTHALYGKWDLYPNFGNNFHLYLNSICVCVWAKIGNNLHLCLCLAVTVGYYGYGGKEKDGGVTTEAV